MNEKANYALLKSLASDISKSAMVDARRSPMTLTEQIGVLESIVEGVRDPMSAAKRVFAREIGEMNTRGGAFKQLVDNYATEAIERAKKTPLPPAKPSTPLKQAGNAGKSATA